jgi:hypothetical protein
MPTPRSELAALTDRLTTTARKSFLEDGQYGATAHLWVQGFPITLAMPTSEDDKPALRALFEVAVRGGADACALVAECWAAGGDPESLTAALAWRESGRSLRDLPNRGEVLMIAAASAAGIERREFDIRRTGKQAHLKKQVPQVPYFNRFLSDLPWPRVRKRR